MRAGHSDAAPFNLVISADDQRIVALLVAQHRGLRQQHAHGCARLDIGTRERAWPQILVGGRERDAHRALPGDGIDDGADLPDAADKGLRHTFKTHQRLLSDLEARHVLFGHLAAHFDFTALGQAEQRRGAGQRDLPDFGDARQHDAIARRHHGGALPARMRFGQLRLGCLGLGPGRERSGAAALEFLGREGIARAFGTHIFRLCGRGVGLQFIERGFRALDLRLRGERIQACEHLPAPYVIARLDQHGGDAAAVALDADRHVVLRADLTGQRHGRGHVAECGHDDRDQRRHGQVLARGGAGRVTHPPADANRQNDACGDAGQQAAGRLATTPAPNFIVHIALHQPGTGVTPPVINP